MRYTTQITNISSYNGPSGQKTVDLLKYSKKLNNFFATTIVDKIFQVNSTNLSSILLDLPQITQINLKFQPNSIEEALKAFDSYRSLTHLDIYEISARLADICKKELTGLSHARL